MTNMYRLVYEILLFSRRMKRKRMLRKKFLRVPTRCAIRGSKTYDSNASIHRLEHPGEGGLVVHRLVWRLSMYDVTVAPVERLIVMEEVELLDRLASTLLERVMGHKGTYYVLIRSSLDPLTVCTLRLVQLTPHQ